MTNDTKHYMQLNLCGWNANAASSLQEQSTVGGRAGRGEW